MLLSEDGKAFFEFFGEKSLHHATGHSSYSATRHVVSLPDRETYNSSLEAHDIRGMNTAVLDGSVVSLRRSEALLDSGRWHPEESAWRDLPILLSPGPCCE
jgi:hypothetical protein